MKRFIGLVLLLAAGAAWAGQPFTILFFNDFHAHFDPYADKATGGEVGGLANLAGLAARIEAENAAKGVPTFLLVAGDAFTGTPYSTAFTGEDEFACLNELRPDAMALGNHEFDYGRARLTELIGTARFPIVAANIRSDDGAGGLLVPAFTWLDAGGKKILVVGLTTPEAPLTTTPGNTKGLTFEAPDVALRRVLAEQGKEADVVVALTHIGFENDVVLAQAVPEVDVIIGGHSHTRVDAAERAGSAVIGQAYCYTYYLGRMDLVLGDDGEVALTSYELLPVTPALPADEGVAAIVAGYGKDLGAKLAAVVGHVDARLTAGPSRERETNFGDFVADAVRDAAHADVALVNGGNLRGDLGPGDVTLGDVETALPFANEIVVLRLRGAQLREAFDYCAREKVGAGGFLQLAGGAVTLAPGVGAREINVGGKPLDDGAEYAVALPDFLAAGGDGYAMFASVPAAEHTGAMITDVVVEALRTGASVPAEPAGRIKLVAP
jgi:2',3'-cyclic-nucleotide 2'-phosphodiesterase (5'-nucleotidase family)